MPSMWYARVSGSADGFWNIAAVLLPSARRPPAIAVCRGVSCSP